jgi:hypothetical protein
VSGSRFDLVDDAGAPAEYMACPFCPGQIMIGHYVPKGGRPTAGLAVIHSTSGTDRRTGCETFDRYDDPGDFLELALPRMIARAALDSLTLPARGRA